jgi:hypothetical protein
LSFWDEIHGVADTLAYIGEEEEMLARFVRRICAARNDQLT